LLIGLWIKKNINIGNSALRVLLSETAGSAKANYKLVENLFSSNTIKVFKTRFRVVGIET
jgi:hypothetical protein